MTVAKMITYLGLGEAARNYNLSKDTVQHFLQTGEFHGAFQGANSVWNIPESEAERVLAKFRGCMRLTVAAKEVGMDATTLSGWIRTKKVVAYKPVVGSNGKTGCTYVDMDSLRSAIADRLRKSEEAGHMIPLFKVDDPNAPPDAPEEKKPSSNVSIEAEIFLLRGAIDKLTGTVSALAQSHAVQVTSTNELAKQVKNLSDWLGEIAIQKA